MSQDLIDAVIFDIDGVLCDSEPIIIDAARQMFAESYNVRVAPEVFKPFTGMGEDVFIGGPAEKMGIKLQFARDKKRTYQIYLQMIKGRLQPLAGAVDFITALRAAGVKTACASSADKMKVDGNLTQLGLPPQTFHAVLTGNDVANKKPAPDIFLAAAARMSMNPNKCLVVEDAPAGCQGARAAGMRCLGLTTSFPAALLREAGAEWTAPDLAHVPPEVPVRK